jgi:hypothetical protein
MAFAVLPRRRDAALIGTVSTPRSKPDALAGVASAESMMLGCGIKSVDQFMYVAQTR